VAEYELSYQLRFQVLGPEGESWSQPETVRSASSYEVDEANVMAGESRRDELSEYLRDEVARLMAARLQAALERNRGGE
jgi:outer membrane lipopolysaccharide assembly protein LptE/RlpB